MGDPNQARDWHGRWVGAGREKLKSAVEYVRSPEGQKTIAKSAVTYALQNALFHMSYVENSLADAYIEHQVDMLAHHMTTTKGHARNAMISAIDKLIKKRRETRGD